MLFHTQDFILFFLLPLLIGFYSFCKTANHRQSLLLIASFGFYAYWDYRLLPLLICSILINWALAYLFHKRHHSSLITSGVIINLSLIALFKYADFLGSSMFWALDRPYTALDILLPLGISFFTFQQTSYLLDLRKGKIRPYGLREYALYVAFFPQLIAGPIVRHNELIDQFHLDPKRTGFDFRIASALVFLTIGMVKKVILSDSAAATSDPLFHKSLTSALTFSESWTALGAFTLQIYFDFSGYSDMAIALALLFGIALPFNFNAPYKALSIQDFWRRWHMTLSRFLRDYLYISFGGNRRGTFVHIYALLFTMLLGGLWHGASWTFVLWGGLHGVALILCYYWQRHGFRLPAFTAWLLTILFVSLAWVLFRAETFQSALNVYQGLLQPYDSVGWPVGKKQGILLIATAVVFLLPTTQNFITQYLKPRLWIAFLCAGFAFLAFLRSGGIYYEDFIYFQF